MVDTDTRELPLGYVRRRDKETGYDYYVNIYDGTSRWTFPKVSALATSQMFMGMGQTIDPDTVLPPHGFHDYKLQSGSHERTSDAYNRYQPPQGYPQYVPPPEYHHDYSQQQLAEYSQLHYTHPHYIQTQGYQAYQQSPPVQSSPQLQQVQSPPQQSTPPLPVPVSTDGPKPSKHKSHKVQRKHSAHKHHHPTHTASHHHQRHASHQITSPSSPRQQRPPARHSSLKSSSRQRHTGPPLPQLERAKSDGSSARYSALGAIVAGGLAAFGLHRFMEETDGEGEGQGYHNEQQYPPGANSGQEEYYYF